MAKSKKSDDVLIALCELNKMVSDCVCFTDEEKMALYTSIHDMMSVVFHSK